MLYVRKWYQSRHHSLLKAAHRPRQCPRGQNVVPGLNKMAFGLSTLKNCTSSVFGQKEDTHTTAILLKREWDDPYDLWHGDLFAKVFRCKRDINHKQRDDRRSQGGDSLWAVKTTKSRLMLPHYYCSTTLMRVELSGNFIHFSLSIKLCFSNCGGGFTGRTLFEQWAWWDIWQDIQPIIQAICSPNSLSLLIGSNGTDLKKRKE